MLAYFGRELTISQLIGRFQFDGETAKSLALDVLAELAFGLSRAKDQQRFCSSNTSQRFVVDLLAFAHEFSLSPVFCNEVIGRVLVLRARPAGSRGLLAA